MAHQIATVTGSIAPADLGGTGIRAGIIKVATGFGAVSDYEKTILRAAALASVETGAPIPDPAAFAALAKIWNPLHFHERVAPRLLDAGVRQEQIDALLVDNPRRFFSGEKPSALA